MRSILKNLYNEISTHRKSYALACVVAGALGSSLVEQRHELFCNSLTPDVTPAMTQAYNDCIQGVKNPMITPAQYERSASLRNVVTLVNGAWVLSMLGLGCAVGYDLGRFNQRRKKATAKDKNFDV